MESNSSYPPLVCYAPIMMTTGGVWRGVNPLDYTFPLFLLQLLLVVLTTRATALLLQPLRQPRYLSEIIGGVLLGPTLMGRIPNFPELVFPFRSVLILETVAYIALIYFIFIIGIEIDVTSVKRSGRSVSFAAACVAIPFAIGSFSGLIVHPELNGGVHPAAFLVFLCVILSISAFSVLARTLAELKLLNTALGATALSSAMLVDSCAWVLLALAIALSQEEGSVKGMFLTLVSGLAFYVSCRAVLRPAMDRITKLGKGEGEAVVDWILVAVLVVALVADAIGIHAISGAFMFGLVIPNGPVGEALVERVEDVVEGLLLPLFFATSGLKTNLDFVKDSGAAFLILMVMTATVAKVGGCLVVAHLYEMPLWEGFSIGLLMNSKGVMEMVLLNIGRDRRLLSEASFSILVFVSIAVTSLVSPLLGLLIRPIRGLTSYQRRTVLWPKPDSELRVVVCVHTTRHVPTMIALLDAAHPSKRSPIAAFAVHLIELTGRASAMLVIHTTTTSKDPNKPQQPLPTSTTTTSATSTTSRAHSNHIIHAFETYVQHAAGISIQTLTAVSPYPTMHQDICAVAEDNHAALIILPFHKQQTVDGGMEATNPAIRSLNQSVLSSAPCSVAILVDRGLRTAGARYAMVHDQQSHHIGLMFLGGPDDREALALANRMAENPGINLTVLRFVPMDYSPKTQRVVSLDDDYEERERRLDEECIAEFRLRYVSDESVAYVEKEVGNAEETVAAIRGMMDGVYDLYIVGRGREVGSKLTAALTDWSECPELGPIGDLLASSDVGATVSVLVVQQCRRVTEKDVEMIAAATATTTAAAAVKVVDSTERRHRMYSFARRT